MGDKPEIIRQREVHTVMYMYLHLQHDKRVSILTMSRHAGLLQKAPMAPRVAMMRTMVPTTMRDTDRLVITSPRLKPP